MYNTNSKDKYQVTVIIWDKEGNELVEEKRVYESLDEARNIDINNIINNAEKYERGEVEF